MKVIVTKDYEEMSDAAFEIMSTTVSENPRAVLGLATGSTPLGLYSRMVADHEKNGTSYKEIKTVNLDEYIGLDSDNKESYAYFMRKNLFDFIDIKKENTNIEDGTAKDFGAECERYNTLLSALRQDIQVLGLGSNGHIAFNEPGTPFNSVTHVVSLSESTIKDNSRLFDSIDDVPKKAFTMGLSNIMNAKKIIILASGENKAKAVYGMVKGKICVDVPASILQNHADTTLICDASAAKLIEDFVK